MERLNPDFSTLSTPPTTKESAIGERPRRDDTTTSEVNLGGEELSQEEARRLLGDFGLTDAQKAELWTALKANAEGVERCVERARATGRRHGRSGAGLLVWMIREGEHLLEPDPSVRSVTGWRFVRGSHSGSYVADPKGTDPLPPGYA
jgi:hypothetical protein